MPLIRDIISREDFKELSQGQQKLVIEAMHHAKQMMYNFSDIGANSRDRRLDAEDHLVALLLKMASYVKEE